MRSLIIFMLVISAISTHARLKPIHFSVIHPVSSEGAGSKQKNYYFHQSGNIVRGEARYNGIGFSGKDNRRFKGTISGSAINLNMSDPYLFEYTPGYVPCNNMRENFTIVQDSLTSSWTASNCGRGAIPS